MRSELTEGLIFGAGIGLAVIAIHVLVDSTLPWTQALALVLVGLVLCALQLGLVLRRGRRSPRPPRQPDPPRRGLERARPAPRSPFDYELNRDWTGLKEPGPKEGVAQAPALDGPAADTIEEPKDQAR